MEKRRRGEAIRRAQAEEIIMHRKSKCAAKSHVNDFNSAKWYMKNKCIVEFTNQPPEGVRCNIIGSAFVSASEETEEGD